MRKQYAIKKINSETFEIIDKSVGSNKVMTYLLLGEKRALLIDSGYGGLDLPTIIKAITSLPVTCVCTHGHVDHAMGAYMFEDSYLHSADSELFKEHSTPEYFRKMAYNKRGQIVSQDGYPSEYVSFVEKLANEERPCPKALEDVEYFDLGGRNVEWFHIPGHTQGSLALFDEKYKLLFDADACGKGVWLFLPESSPLKTYRKDLSKYYEYALSKGSPKRYVGHMTMPLKTKDIKKLLDCVDVAIEGENEPHHIVLGMGEADVLFAKGGFMFYDKNRIE